MEQTSDNERGVTRAAALEAPPGHQAALEERLEFMAAHGGGRQAPHNRLHADEMDVEALSIRARELDERLSALYARVPDRKDFQRQDEWWAAYKAFEAEVSPLGDELADVDYRLGELGGQTPPV